MADKRAGYRPSALVLPLPSGGGGRRAEGLAAGPPTLGRRPARAPDGPQAGEPGQIQISSPRSLARSLSRAEPAP